MKCMEKLVAPMVFLFSGATAAAVQYCKVPVV